ncbi:ParB N-terminal domain-containing protein [Cereibacter sphaeroides]|nr:ParB N-terminal domain-containing protein [Cereibacter sphaeroides]
MNQIAPEISAEATALVPLADCYVHPLNTRSEPPTADIEALAASIEDIGLLQNLAGWFDPAAPGKVGIVAGGRRLRALAVVAVRQGHSPDDTRVPVKIAPDEDTARIWASAENAARASLHPADEVRAYGRMMRDGYFADAIARAFAVTERHVRQRLRLAQLPELALTALRDGRLSLDQAAALTAGQSTEATEAELQRVLKNPGWGSDAAAIRRNLTEATIPADDARVRLIGLDAYRAAGGTVLEDLFTDKVRLQDEAILDQLVGRQLSDCVDELLAQGWKWVEVIKSEDRWAMRPGMTQIERQPVDLPEADAEELEDLESRANEEELSEGEIARLNELEERAAGDYSDEDRATSGLFIFLDRSGTIEHVGPYRRREDDPALEGGRAGAETGGKVEVRAIPNGLAEDLKKARLAALQARAAERGELMLDLMAYQQAADCHGYAAVLRITFDRQPIAPEKADGLDLPVSIADPDPSGRDRLSIEGFEVFRALGKKHRNEVLTRAAARSLCAHDTLAPFLADLLDPNPREIWTPTAAGYFSRLPVPVLDRLWVELLPEDRREGLAFADQKKGEKAKTLERLFNDTDFREALGLSREINARLDAWVPEQLQWPALEGEA